MSATHPIDVDSLLNGGVESSRLEFKVRWDQYTTGPEVLLKICEFANDYDNLNGGYVLVGVDERDGRAVLPPPGLSAEKVEAARYWIRNKCRQFKPPYRPKLIRKTVDEQFVLIIWAPVSDNRPHCGPYGGSSTKDDQRETFGRVVRASKEIIQEYAQYNTLDQAEDMLCEFEAESRRSLSLQGATSANSHVRNALVGAAINAKNNALAECLLRGEHFAPSGYDALDTVLLAWRVGDALLAVFGEKAGPRALLVSAQVKIRLAHEAHSEYERQRFFADACKLLELAKELKLSATQSARAKRLAEGLGDLQRNPTRELGQGR